MAGEHVPERLARRVQPELIDDAGEEPAQDRARAEGGGIAAVRVDDPFSAEGEVGQGAASRAQQSPAVKDP